MARNKLLARANYNCRRANFWQRRVRSGIKNIEGRIRNRDTKMGKLLDKWLWEEKQYFQEIDLYNIEY